MASVSTDASGNVRILFSGADGKRKTLYLGPIPKKAAQGVKSRVEHLAALARLRQPMDAETIAWTKAISDDLAAKLAAADLIPARPSALSLKALLDLYLAEKERDNKPGTKTNHEIVANDLIGHFTAEKPIRAITDGEAGAFLNHLKERELASATVARRLRRVRSVFAHAVKRGLIPANPFAELKAATVLPADRKAYVPAGDAIRLIDAANPCWKAIVALARFGGLRCPSEVLTLRWANVDFDAGRVVVFSPKTERIPGKETRTMPLFAELRPHLELVRAHADKAEAYVVGGPQGDRYRATAQGPKGWVGTNLRTTFEKLVNRVGLTPWPRLFHTLRASCETDLLERFPISAVTEWLGHSAAVALKHYARVPEHLFRLANGNADSDALQSQNPTQPAAATNCQKTTKSTGTLENKASRRLVSHPDGHCQDDQVTLRGFEPPDVLPLKTSEKRSSAQTGNADSDAVRRVAAAWPTLPEPIRLAILSLVDAAPATHRRAA